MPGGAHEDDTIVLDERSQFPASDGRRCAGRGTADTRPPCRAGEVPCCRRKEALGQGRRLRHVPSQSGRRALPRPRPGGSRLRGDGRKWDQHRADVHGPASVAARRRRGQRAPRAGRSAVGAARRLPRRPEPYALDRVPHERRSAFLRRPRRGVGIFGRQRDPGADRALARTQARRAVPRPSVRGGEGGGSRRARDVRELPVDRVPRAAVPRLSRVQRVRRGARVVFRIPRTPPEPRGRSTPGHDRDRARQPPARRRQAGSGPRLAGAFGVRRRMCRCDRLHMDGRVVRLVPVRHGRPDRGRRGDRGLGFRARRPRAAPEACARGCPEHVRGCPGARAARVAARLGRRVLAQRLRDLDYPDYEVIVVDDGSADETSAVASDYGFRVIRTVNRGLSSARNTGFEAATGEYVAYLDDDAWPDRDWLTFIVRAFESTGAAAVGGPNIAPPDDSGRAEAIACAPGGPIHVLLDDSRAEHLPGCNLAVRSSVLEDLRGFDPIFRVAGDDVDLCWRLLERGDTIVYSPGAMVWHRRRRSIRAYLRQQRGYGRAEALLEQKWPDKYDAGGHGTWNGRIYDASTARSLGSRRSRIYYGSWGTGLFQRLYRPSPSLVDALRLTPEWWLVLVALGALSLLSVAWTPLIFALPLFLLGLSRSVIQAVMSSGRSCAGKCPSLRWRVLTAALYLAQPIARLAGRVGNGLTPWRRPRGAQFAFPFPRAVEVWSEAWRPADAWLHAVEERLREGGVASVRGGDYDRWDLRVTGGMLVCARLRHVIEEHGGGRQLVRFRIVPGLSRAAVIIVSSLGALGAVAAWDGARLAE